MRNQSCARTTKKIQKKGRKPGPITCFHDWGPESGARPHALLQSNGSSTSWPNFNKSPPHDDSPICLFSGPVLSNYGPDTAQLACSPSQRPSLLCMFPQSMHLQSLFFFFFTLSYKTTTTTHRNPKPFQFSNSF